MKKLFKGPPISLGGDVHPRLSCLGSTNTILGQHLSNVPWFSYLATQYVLMTSLAFNL